MNTIKLLTAVLVSTIITIIAILIGPNSGINKLTSRTSELEQTVTEMKSTSTQQLADYNTALSQATLYMETVNNQLSQSISDLQTRLNTATTSLDSINNAVASA